MAVMDVGLAQELEDIRSKEVSYWRMVWDRFRRHRLAMFGGATLTILILLSLTAPLITRFSPEEIDRNAAQFATPDSEHWLGTDNISRDVFSRLLYAGRVSLFIGFLATIMGASIGITVGSLAGYYGGWVDTILMRLTDVMLSLPLLPLLLILSAFLRQMNIWSSGGDITILQVGVICIILVLFGWFQDARLIRGSILSLRGQDMVEASRALGASDARLIISHLLPNSLAPIIVSATLAIGNYIVLESALSFLGLGINPPTASWGNMLSDFQTYMLLSPMLAFYPGFCIFMTVLSANFLGDGLRDALDPRLKV